MKKKIVLLVFVLFGFVTFGQKNKEIDSLTNKLNKSNDSVKIIILDELAWRLKYNDPNSAKNYISKGLELSVDKFESKKITFYNTLGIIFRQENNIDEAIKSYNKSLKLSQKHNNRYSICAAYINLGVVYKNLKEHKEAISYYNLAEKNIDTTTKSAHRLKNVVIINRATVYLEMDNDSLALKEFLRAEKISKQNDFKQNLETLYHNISLIYEGILDYRNALDYKKKSLELAKKVGNKLNISQSYNTIGINFLKLNEKDSAIVNINKGLKIAELIKDKNEIGYSHYGLGEYFIKYDNFKEVIKHSKLSLKNIGKGRYKSDIVHNHINLAKSYIHLKKFNDAKNHLDISFKMSTNEKLEVKQSLFKNYKLYYYSLGKISDALFFGKKEDSIITIMSTENKVKVVNNINIKYQTQQKENQILTLRNQAQQKELVLQESKTKTNYAFASIFLVVLGGGLYLRKRKKDQKFKILEQSVKSTEQEKVRIGKELHDGIASNLRLLAHETENTNVNLSHKLLDSYVEIRNLSHQLNNTPIHGELFLDRVYEIIPKNDENRVFNLKIEPTYLELIEPYSTHLYRIVQELITNNLKYANASQTKIEVNLKDNILTLNYLDDGVGTLKLNKGSGLKSIEDRVTLLNGIININSEKGFNISIGLPYKN